MKRILAVDGGGVRGVIPAVVLAALERSVGGRIRDHFDFVAGTSTGALIAGAAAAGIPADWIVRLYLERAQELFHRIPLVTTARRIAFGHMYDVRSLREMVGEELASQEAASWRLNDLPVDVMVTAKGLRDGHPWYFVRDRPGRNSARTGNLLLADCLAASAAAPTYFAPYPLPGLEERGPMVDGGIGVAGNPVYQACVEAFSYCHGYRPEETIVVSMGTGQFLDRSRPTWLWSWLGWVLAELLRSPGEQQTELVDRHFPTAQLYRMDVRLDRDYPLDDVNHLAALRDLGQRLADEVDWPAILSGEDTRWAVTPGRRHAAGYAEEV